MRRRFFSLSHYFFSAVFGFAAVDFFAVTFFAVTFFSAGFLAAGLAPFSHSSRKIGFSKAPNIIPRNFIPLTSGQLLKLFSISRSAKRSIGLPEALPTSVALAHEPTTAAKADCDRCVPNTVWLNPESCLHGSYQSFF